ncbi:MAG TPA: MFS transporter [Rhizomicrobium sp.]|jgi:FSR family fosmidomycin resistance protein-like MFS transporter|nr:MFS transporter [Rhizomicrobium sp.]
MTDTTATPLKVAQDTSFAVLFAISFCHLLNDMMQALLPAIYPTLKADFHLSFAQIGVITAVFQGTASLLQPWVGYASDRRPMPYSLPLGMVSTLAGLLVLGFAGSYAIVLLAAMLVGLGSSIFHPESARVARMASGGRHGFAQSLFQTGGNIGSALGPLTAAFMVALYGQRGVAWYAGAALLGIIILTKVGSWYKHHGLARIRAAHKAMQHEPLPLAQVLTIIFILALLIFSKYFYLVSISNYFTFYLIQTFHISVPSAQLHLFYFLAAVAVGAFAGGPLGDRFGRKYVIWVSILGPLPFTLMLPYANLFWTEVLSVVIGAILASAFPAIVVYAQELLPGKLGMISGVFYGFSFGMGAIGAALLGLLADATSITFVYKVCAFLPLMGLLTVFLPDLKKHE